MEKNESKRAYDPGNLAATADLKISSHHFLQGSFKTSVWRIQTQKVVTFSKVASDDSLWVPLLWNVHTHRPAHSIPATEVTGLLTIWGNSIWLSRLWVGGIRCRLLHSCGKLCLPICSHSLWGRGRENMWVWSAICQKWQKIESPCIRWKHAR